MTEPTMVDAILRAITEVPEEHVVTGWTFSMHDWQQLLALGDALNGFLAYTSDPKHPLLCGLPVTIDPDLLEGYRVTHQ